MKKKKILTLALAALSLTMATTLMSGCTLPDPHVVFPFLYESSEGDTPGSDTPGGTTTMTGYYTSNKNIAWQNMTPAYNYYFMVICEQSIETFDDMTYCLTVTAQMFSNVHYGPEYRNDPEDADHLATSNEQAHVITRYYGTYEEIETKKSSITISLQAPTRVFYAKQGGAYYDTLNWTEKMSSNADGLTAEAYLKSKMVGEQINADGSTTEYELFPSGGVEVYIKTSGCSFEILQNFLVTYIG